MGGGEDNKKGSNGNFVGLLTLFFIYMQSDQKNLVEKKM